MRTMRYLSLVAGAGLLAGCIGLDVEQINEVEAVGNPFTQQLTVEYRDLANFEAFEMNDWSDADRYGRKGVAAANGEVVLPDDLSIRSLPSDAVNEVEDARGRLTSALDGNARANFPVEAAKAQARFDCWVEQLDENVQPSHIRACRDEFYFYLNLIETPPVPEAPPVYFVFFDFDSSAITEAGAEIINQIAMDFEDQGQPVVDVVGFTDTSGSAQYNQALSIRRANAVEQALLDAGIPADQINISGRGENDLLVQTPDGVREPSNRRAEIRFQ